MSVQAKQVLRKQMKLALKGIPATLREEKSKDITEKVKASELYAKSKRVAVYVPMPDEVDTTYLLKDIFDSDKTCFIPRYDSGSRDMEMLQLYSMADLAALPKTKWNIPQPEEDADTRENALESGGLDLVLMPGLAFTQSGKRLGRGKGYYDTYLLRHKKLLDRYPITIALSFAEQIQEQVPTSEHDVLLDYVFSDKLQ
ncbi:5-formyltetrahydrofolate cyclo-ligase-like [Watersipora subatra]|uniref:5-formyltetrahydrofolate cyclo-ligase-like n=1 Tax=Watersipora subatra TaxID=2589382 RepID=UPI00355B3806